MGVSAVAFPFSAAGSLQMFAVLPFLLMAVSGPQKILAQEVSGGINHLSQSDSTWAALPTTFVTSRSTVDHTFALTAATSVTTQEAIDGRAIADVGVMTISITNSYGTPLSLSYASNAPADGTTFPPPIGNPTPAMLPPGAATAIAYPTGWAGRITVGKVITDQGGKIEGSTTGANDIDVSYVDGYTVPITCSSAGVAVSGCNIELFKQGIACDGTLADDGTTCQNPNQGVPNGPASSFFAACAGAAYTYPNDNLANNGYVDTIVTCCIGISCQAPVRQGALSQQRDFSPASAKFAKEKVLNRNIAPRLAGGPSLLPHLYK